MSVHNDKTCTKYPWYDDRTAKLFSSESSGPLPETGHEVKIPDEFEDEFYVDCADEFDDDMSANYDTPQKIYDYLNQHVWKQDAAKKAASIITYNCLRGVKNNAMYIGPTGCGKTHIWRCLKNIFPDMIEIVDGSCITQDGWKGSVKWRDLLSSPVMLSGSPAILVIDEADKMLAPKYSHDENVSKGIQAEGLTMLEGTRVTVNDGPAVREVDTSKISFVLCGAFSTKAQDVAEKSGGRHIGFGAVSDKPSPYEKALCEQDLLDFGVMPEFLGRIQRLVNLEPMTEEDYYQMTGSFDAILQRIRQQYGAEIRLTPKKRRELAELAYSNGLGVRGMENKIRSLVDDALFEDCEQKCFEF